MTVLNKTDYIEKMNSILEDETKFLTHGPSSEKDSTSKIESRIQHLLLQLHKDDLLPANLHDLIRPTGSQRPRMYGLTKAHKKDVPLRPILNNLPVILNKATKQSTGNSLIVLKGFFNSSADSATGLGLLSTDWTNYR